VTRGNRRIDIDGTLRQRPGAAAAIQATVGFHDPRDGLTLS
jgi:hypothetical protein